MEIAIFVAGCFRDVETTLRELPDARNVTGGHTEIAPATVFWAAEECQQQYEIKRERHCSIPR
jgi:peptide methionine sulfoxide reductase MsrA